MKPNESIRGPIRPAMEPTILREPGCMWLIVIACIFLLTLSATAQVGTRTLDEALMSDRVIYSRDTTTHPDPEYDTIKVIMLTTSDSWGNNNYSGELVAKKSGYLVREQENGFFAGTWMKGVKYLDHKKEPLKNTIVWDANYVTAGAKVDTVLIGNYTPKNYFDIDEHQSIAVEPDDMRRPAYSVKGRPYIGEPEYDSSKYVRISEYQSLKQQLNDSREAYRREIALHVTVKFCTFMEPEKAAQQGVIYAEALLKELEKIQD